MFKLATGYLGISFSDYYNTTPRELQLMFQGYGEKQKQETELQEIATRVAIINAMNKKNFKVFGEKKEKSKTVDQDRKSAELDYLKGMFV
ncbi:hypothetical protein [Alkaliphilus transvaalensis]|uniref:hypothetical protein n=1 Tax=Alkaliphilus transvaalensis TaxID=114628 RepID=UPI00047E0016|nr:hypothetical protein [Alkaliphilus transvaalensis]